MSNKRKQWKATEDSKLLTQVKAYPQNLQKAFKEASKELPGRTVGACSNRWYTALSKDYKNNPEAVCFAVFSKKRYGVNRKNCKIESSVTANNSVWKSIINFIKRLK